MKYILHTNGRWDLLGEKFRLTNVFPAVNGTVISPLRVSAGRDSVVYELKEGCLELRFGMCGDDLTVTCRVSGMSGIHDVEPLGDSVVCGAERAFVQGFGTEGPSGVRKISGERLESNGLAALCGEESAFFVYARDHRHYVNRYCICKRETLFSEGDICLLGGFDLEGTAGEELTLPALFFHEDSGLYFGLTFCAEKIAESMNARKTTRPAFHWCSWYYLYQNMNQELLREYLDGFPPKEDIPFQYVQIDAGYAPSLGDWLLPCHRYPDGLKKAAETILSAGYRPGIWIGPFMVGDASELYRCHPDWILRNLDGNPVTQIRSYNEPKVWGNRDGNYYVLDTSHPEALAYLRDVFATLRKWGFSLFKTDFMLWNMHDTSKVRRYDSSRTSVEILRDTLRVIREAVGEESYLLGCIAPFLPFVGFADGMRIAGDVGAQWAEDYGPVNMIRELVSDSYFNNIYWQNDPDSVLLRDFDIFLKPQEIRSLALLQALSGGVVTTSDPLHRIAEERMELLRFITPSFPVCPQFPSFEKETPEVLLTHSLPQGKLLYVLNPAETPLTVVCRFGELFGEESWNVREYGGEALGETTWYAKTLAPHECVLLFLTKEPLEREPKNLWVW